MAKKIVTWTCEICGESFGSEKECLAHEATHAKEISCKYVKANGKKDECKSTVLISRAITLEWVGGSKSQTKRFEYDSSNIPDVYTDEGEIDDDGHIRNSCDK